MFTSFKARGDNSKKFNVIFVLGGPGAGKGTQCANIVKEYGFIHLSAGDLLREEMAAAESKYGEMIKKHMKDGTIVPVKVTCGLLEQAMERSLASENKNNFLIDGFPRNADNREGWETEMAGKTNLLMVLVFDCSDDVCVARCTERGKDSGRVDDNAETLKKRLTQFKSQCQPIIEHYGKQNLVRHIDASGSADEVFALVKKCFDEVAAAK